MHTLLFVSENHKCCFERSRCFPARAVFSTSCQLAMNPSVCWCDAVFSQPWSVHAPGGCGARRFHSPSGAARCGPAPALLPSSQTSISVLFLLTAFLSGCFCDSCFCLWFSVGLVLGLLCPALHPALGSLGFLSMWIDVFHRCGQFSAAVSSDAASAPISLFWTCSHTRIRHFHCSHVCLLL